MLGTNGNPVIFAGNSHPQLVRDICDYLGQDIGQVEVFKFSNDNTFVKILENVRQKDVFILQSTVEPVNDHIMEMLIMIDAFKRFQISDELVEKFGYKKLTKEDKAKIFGLNAAKVYGVDLKKERKAFPEDSLSKLKAAYHEAGGEAEGEVGTGAL